MSETAQGENEKWTSVSPWLAAHQLKLRNADVVGRSLGASGSVLFAGSVCTVGGCRSGDPRLTRAHRACVCS